MSISLTEDLKCDLDSLNENAIVKSNRVKISKHFCQFVQFHSDSKQLSDFYHNWKRQTTTKSKSIFRSSFRLVSDFSETMQFPNIFLFSWGIAAICILMLMLQNQLVQYNIQFIFVAFTHVSIDFFFFSNLASKCEPMVFVLISQIFWTFMWHANALRDWAKPLKISTVKWTHSIGINIHLNCGKCYQFFLLVLNRQSIFVSLEVFLVIE